MSATKRILFKNVVSYRYVYKFAVQKNIV